MKGLVLAWQFLTRLPIPYEVEFNPKNIRASLAFFPWVSLIIGLMAALLGSWVRPYSSALAGLFTLLVWIFLTGGLHLDGVADTFDGFLANKDRKRTLEIMTDSRLGTFGGLGLIILVLAKWVLLSETDFSPLDLGLVAASARLGVLALVLSYPSARPGGLGEAFQVPGDKRGVLVSALGVLALVIIHRPALLVMVLANLGLATALGRISIKKIGGVSGDIFGLVQEYGEVLGLMVLWGVIIWS